MILTFDIETIPNLEFGREVHELYDLKDREVAKAMLAVRRLKYLDTDFLPLQQQKIIAISVAVRWENRFLVKSLGSIDSDEKSLIEEFFRGVAQAPTLVSWNGNGFDLPVIHYRALHHMIASQTYWELGDDIQSFRWNNYQGRFHERHTDLMDILARYQPRNFASLDDVAKLIGLPGKIGIGGDGIFEAYLDDRMQEIRNYCEIDSLNTFLIFLRFQYIRAKFSMEEYQKEIRIVQSWLAQSKQVQFLEFLESWTAK